MKNKNYFFKYKQVLLQR